MFAYPFLSLKSQIYVLHLAYDCHNSYLHIPVKLPRCAVKFQFLSIDHPLCVFLPCTENSELGFSCCLDYLPLLPKWGLLLKSKVILTQV